MSATVSPEEWGSKLLMHQPARWNDLPDLDLYMDQVITLLTRELALFTTEEEKPITSNMINNYVKDGVIPRPDKKKYNREHFARLIMLCQLKSVLTIPEIEVLLDNFIGIDSAENTFGAFSDLRDATLQEVVSAMAGMEQMDSPEKRMETALKFALISSIYRSVAANLIAAEKKEQLAEEVAKKAEEEAKKKEKNKDKKQKKDTPAAE